MRQQAKSSLHSITGCATNSSLLGLFLSALRFIVAVIFKGVYGALGASRAVSSTRALASVSLYFVGEGFVMGVQSGSRGYGMLSKQLDDTADKAGQRGIKAIARRVSTLAQVYDHLLGAEMTRTTDFGSYVKSLCLNLEEIQGAPQGTVTLTCNSEPLILDLDVVTALGIVVAEVVTNSYDHAFPSGKGSIIVSVQSAFGDVDSVTMTISDDGKGFKAQTESKRHGLGLVRRLVEQVRGIASLDSENGTVWTIKFPRLPTALPVAIKPDPVGAGQEAA